MKEWKEILYCFTMKERERTKEMKKKKGENYSQTKTGRQIDFFSDNPNEVYEAYLRFNSIVELENKIFES